jgi:hypothetical protein
MMNHGQCILILVNTMLEVQNKEFRIGLSAAVGSSLDIDNMIKRDEPGVSERFGDGIYG